MISAGETLRNIAWRKRTAQLRQLDDLGPAEREAVVAVLAELPPDSWVDLDKLIEEVRRREVERTRAVQPDPLAAFRYWITFAPLEQLKACRAALKEGASVEEAMASAQKAPQTGEQARVRKFRPALAEETRDDEKPDEQNARPARAIGPAPKGPLSG